MGGGLGGRGHWNAASLYLLPRFSEKQEECLSARYLLGACQASKQAESLWKTLKMQCGTIHKGKRLEDMAPSLWGLDGQSPWEKMLSAAGLRGNLSVQSDNDRSTGQSLCIQERTVSEPHGKNQVL